MRGIWTVRPFAIPAFPPPYRRGKKTNTVSRPIAENPSRSAAWQRAVSPLFVLFVRAAHSWRFTSLTALPAPPKVTATAGRLQVVRLPSARWKLSQSQRRAPTSRDLVSLLNRGGCNPLLTYLVCYKRPLCYGTRIPAWKLNIRKPVIRLVT